MKNIFKELFENIFDFIPKDIFDPIEEDGPSPQILPLDVATSTALGFEFRKIRTAYSGACFRVRRSSDNAEQDIGFAPLVIPALYQYVDTAALLAFCGAFGSGYIKIWYNQAITGSAYDAIQTSQANQPAVVSSGSLITSGSFLTPQFSRAQWFVVANGAALALTSQLEMLFVGSSTINNVQVSTIYDKRDPSNYYAGSTVYISTGFGSGPASFQWIGTLGVQPNAGLGSVGNNTFCMINIDAEYQNNASSQINQGSVVTASIAGAVGTPTNSLDLLLGGHINNPTYRFGGKMAAFILCSDSANSNYLQTNYKAYYGL